MKKLKIGDRVIFTDHRSAQYPCTVWECRGNSYVDDAGQLIVWLSGYDSPVLLSDLKKLKQHVITVARKFHGDHPRAGAFTKFPELIATSKKKHTIRAGKIWKKRVDDVNAGTHFLSVRIWIDKPYRSKQVEIAAFTKLGYQEFEYKMNYDCMTPYIDGRLVDPDNECDLAENDGLSRQDFHHWFNYPEPFKGGIIHFTPLRYWSNPAYFISPQNGPTQ